MGTTISYKNCDKQSPSKCVYVTLGTCYSVWIHIGTTISYKNCDKQSPSKYSTSQKSRHLLGTRGR